MQFLSNLGSSPLIHPAFLGDDRQIDPPATWLPQRREKRRKQKIRQPPTAKRKQRGSCTQRQRIFLSTKKPRDEPRSLHHTGKWRSRCANTKARVSNAQGFRFERQMHVWRRILITLVGKHAVYIQVHTARRYHPMKSNTTYATMGFF